MPARDGTGPRGEERGKTPCITEKQLPRENKEPKEITEKQLPRESKEPKEITEKQLDKGRGDGGGGKGRRKGPNGVTYFT